MARPVNCNVVGLFCNPKAAVDRGRSPAYGQRYFHLA